MILPEFILELAPRWMAFMSCLGHENSDLWTGLEALGKGWWELAPPPTYTHAHCSSVCPNMWRPSAQAVILEAHSQPSVDAVNPAGNALITNIPGSRNCEKQTFIVYECPLHCILWSSHTHTHTKTVLRLYSFSLLTKRQNSAFIEEAPYTVYRKSTHCWLVNSPLEWMFE